MDNRSSKSTLIRQVIFGWHDGIFTTLGFVSGATGLFRDNYTIFLAGLAALVAEGISMGVSNYQSVKSQNDLVDKEVKREKFEMRTKPKEEWKEVYEIYLKKGLSKKKAEKLANIISSNKKAWLRTMMAEELGLSLEKEKPLSSAVEIGVAAWIGAFIPIFPYLLFKTEMVALLSAVAFSMIFLFLVGVFKTRFTMQSWWKEGLKLMMTAVLTAVVTYSIGLGFNYLIG